MVRADDQPAWAEMVRRVERGEPVAVIMPSGEWDRLRETIEVLSDTELVRDLREGLADARAGRCSPPSRSRLTWPPAAIALYEHLTGPVAANPRRLGEPLDAPFEDVLPTPAR